MHVIPAIDLLSGKAVRLRQGRYDDVTVYDDDPAELAASWSEHVERLHVDDLEGAREGHAVQGELVRRIVTAFPGHVQVGGGVRSFQAASGYLELGVERVVLGTAALRNAELVRQLAHAFPRRIVLAVDARAGFVSTEGWLTQSTTRAAELVRSFEDSPLAAVLYTDIERDGMEVGPNVTETVELGRETGRAVIASGGVGTLEHLRALGARAAEGGIVAAIVGRALHEKRFSLAEAVAAAASG
jgi:phosphoribosylformimino-5-aminoimidazole carboxamide ribotide isomerase